MDGRCAICSEEFDEDERIPRLIPSCGLSYCQKCIIQAQYDPNCCFECPIDNELHSLAYEVDTLPINIALIKTLSDMKATSSKQINLINISDTPEQPLSSSRTPLAFSSSVSSASEGEKCHYHQKIKEFRCKEDNQYVCSHCVLFGNHQSHQIQSVNRGALKINKQRMNGLFEQVMQKMGELDCNIKQFLEPPNCFVKNLANLKKELKYELKRTFKNFYEILKQKQHQIQKQIDDLLQDCQTGMEDLESELNMQYSTICCIKQQINQMKSEINTNDGFPHSPIFSSKKIEEVLTKIVNTSDQLVRLNQEIIQKCHEIGLEYKEKINNREFIKIKDTKISLNGNDDDQREINLMENSNLLEIHKSRNIIQDKKQNVGISNTYVFKSNKPSMFALNQQNRVIEFDTLPQSSFLQPSFQSKPPLKPHETNRMSELTLRSSQSNNDLSKSYISSSYSPTKNLQRYNSVFIQSSSSSLLLSKPSQSVINRSKIQSIKDQQQKRQAGKLEMRKKVTKIIQSIQSQKGTTLELIGMDIKDYYINQIFNFIKKSNKKYGLIKLVKNEITDEGFNRILNQLKDYQYAHTLNLTSNCLTEECLEWIADFGMYNKYLKNIYLKNNQINHIKTKEKKQQVADTGINLYY